MLFGGGANRVASLMQTLFFALCAIFPTLPAFTLRYMDHTDRPALYILQSSEVEGFSERRLYLSEDQPLHIRTHNLGFVPTTVGDFNTSRATAWGEDNMSTEQPEKKVMEKFNQSYHDLFLEDHDKVTGQRFEGVSRFLAADNVRLGQENLVEPSGSWYHGPFADRGATLKIKTVYEQMVHGSEIPIMTVGIDICTSTWGTKERETTQTANTARFDYITVPQGQKDTLKGCVEIRRVIGPKGSQSAATDHLPVDGKIWIKSKVEVDEFSDSL